MEFSGKRHKKKELKEEKYKEYHQKRSKRRRKKFSASSSDSSSDSDSSSLSSDEERCRQKRLKVKKKSSLKEKKCKKMNSTENLGTDKVMSNIAIDTIHSDNEVGPTVEEARKCMAPMTKAEWEKQQSVTRRVYDPETGRKRLIKGDGEILEEIVSKERHREINKAATRQDGEYFKKKLGLL